MKRKADEPNQSDKISDLYFMLMVNDHINEKLHEEIDKKNDTIKDLQKQVDERDDEISDLKDEIDSLKTQLEDQRQEITRLRWERL